MVVLDILLKRALAIVNSWKTSCDQWSNGSRTSIRYLINHSVAGGSISHAQIAVVAGMNAVENNELVQSTSEAIFEKEAKKLKKQEEEIKAKVCTKNMSQSACNKASIAERDRINEESYNTVVGIATNIPVIGVVDSGKIIITGRSLTGEETNRLWGVAGIISLGNGQKVKNVINKIARIKSSAKANKGTTVVKPTVTAELEVNGVKFKDTNQKARPADKANANESTLIADKIRDKEIVTGKKLPNWNMANAHA